MKTTAATAAAIAMLSTAGSHGAGIDAEYVATSTRALADGNTIEHETMGRFAQDDEGRTRFEVGNNIDIMDPMAGTRWTVDKRLGQAFRSEMPQRWQETVDPGSTGGIIRKMVGDASQIPASSELPEFDRPTIADLGPATVNGLAANGTLYKDTIQVGAMGNKEPMVVETEVWWSEDHGFRLPVKTEVRDPFNGHSVQVLRNIRTLELGEDLFRPDPKYPVVEAPVRQELQIAVPGR